MVKLTGMGKLCYVHYRNSERQNAWYSWTVFIKVDSDRTQSLWTLVICPLTHCNGEGKTNISFLVLQEWSSTRGGGKGVISEQGKRPPKMKLGKWKMPCEIGDVGTQVG